MAQSLSLPLCSEGTASLVMTPTRNDVAVPMPRNLPTVAWASPAASERGVTLRRRLAWAPSTESTHPIGWARSGVL